MSRDIIKIRCLLKNVFRDSSPGMSLLDESPALLRQLERVPQAKAHQRTISLNFTAMGAANSFLFPTRCGRGVGFGLATSAAAGCSFLVIIPGIKIAACTKRGQK